MFFLIFFNNFFRNNDIIIIYYITFAFLKDALTLYIIFKNYGQDYYSEKRSYIFSRRSD